LFTQEEQLEYYVTHHLHLWPCHWPFSTIHDCLLICSPGRCLYWFSISHIAHLVTMATALTPQRIRPYRRFLTSALHRRFVHASVLALIICWDDAFWLGNKTSCGSIPSTSHGQALTRSRFLVLVPNQLNWRPNYPHFRVMLSHLHPSSGYTTAGPSIDHFTL
jgi:hypothetical protein